MDKETYKERAERKRKKAMLSFDERQFFIACKHLRAFLLHYLVAFFEGYC